MNKNYTAQAMNPRNHKTESAEFIACGNYGYLVEFADGGIYPCNGILEVFNDGSYPEVSVTV